ncbi:hypothetical protein [Priestia megaterium]
MFENTLIAELATRFGSQVEIALQSGSVTGTLINVSESFVSIVEDSSGYAPATAKFIPVGSIIAIEFFKKI